MTKINVPLSAPDGNEEAYLVDALRSTWISSSGNYVDRFESQFADLVGTRYASSAANGTVALRLALVALGVGRGDEVIVPALTYVAVANAVKYTGARLVLVDVDPRTWCLDPAKIEASITSRTRGVIAVHNYGHPCDMDAINKIAKSFKLWVIEDAAEAHFATYNGRTAGGLADIATFSFYGNKVITSGEGGALTYNDESLHHRIRMLRSQGMDRTRRFDQYRVCALVRPARAVEGNGCAPERDLQVLFQPLVANSWNWASTCRHWASLSPWLYCITVDESLFDMNRDTLAVRLQDHGIETRPFFVCIHQMPIYQQHGGAESFHVSEQLSRDGMNLPTFHGMTDDTVDQVCATIEKIHLRGA
ncbi:MAG: DegT/DnrJ/EryC1/StrS family aminotransferase [Methylocella sp.]